MTGSRLTIAHWTTVHAALGFSVVCALGCSDLQTAKGNQGFERDAESDHDASGGSGGSRGGTGGGDATTATDANTPDKPSDGGGSMVGMDAASGAGGAGGTHASGGEGGEGNGGNAGAAMAGTMAVMDGGGDGDADATVDECATEARCSGMANTHCADPSVEPGDSECVCDSGYTRVGASCQCDLTGTFAVETVTTLTWSEQTIDSNTYEASSASGVPTRAWALWDLTYSDTGELHVVERACGGTTIDGCNLTHRRATGASLPEAIWDRATMPSNVFAIQLPNALPGDPFQTGVHAALLGAEMSDPLGSWHDANVSWPDHDGDGEPGVTLLSRSSGTSACPRLSSSPAGTYAYARPIVNFTHEVSHIYVAARIISAYSGTLMSCNFIIGSMIGSGGGPYQMDGSVLGCRGTGYTCSATDVAAVARVLGAARENIGATFRINRLADTNGDSEINCIDVRQFYGN